MAKSIKFVCPTSGRETQWRSVCKKRFVINHYEEYYCTCCGARTFIWKGKVND